METLVRFLSSTDGHALRLKVIILAICVLIAGFIQWHEVNHPIY